jgi:hypothetical protein
MTARADGMRRIATANTTLATVSVAGVVGLTAMLAQQGVHHTTASTTTVRTTTGVSQPSAVNSEASGSDDAPATTTTTTQQAPVQQAPAGSVQHVVTSGS